MVKLLLMSILLLSGCTDAYYQAQGEYYRNQAAVIVAQRPLSRVVVNGMVIETANPNDIKTILPACNPVVDILSTIVNSTPAAIVSGGWAAGRVMDASTGDNNSISTVDNHSAVSEPTIVTQPAPTIVPAADLAIVTQPEPVIVRPEIVKPEIVKTQENADGY